MLSERNMPLWNRFGLTAHNGTVSLNMATFEQIIDAAHEEGKEGAFAAIRAQWKGDETCRRLDDVRQNIAGLRPGDAVVIAAFQQEFAARIAITENQAKLLAEYVTQQNDCVRGYQSHIKVLKEALRAIEGDSTDESARAVALAALLSQQEGQG